MISFNDYYKSLVSEMVERPVKQKGDNIIAFQGNIWRYTSDSLATDDAALQDIEDKTGITKDELFILDGSYMSDAIKEERPDVLFGTIYKNWLYIDSTDELTHSPNSPIISKIVKFYKLNGYKYNTYDADDNDQEVEIASSELSNELSKYAYHGTNAHALIGIIKTGLTPNSNNTKNWAFSFTDRIFLTTKFDYAMFHANNSAQKQKSIPIILKVKIPDTSKIASDYDVAAKYGEGDSDDDYEYQLSKTSHRLDYDRRDKIKKYSPKTNFTKNSGIFSYKGRIPPTYITDLYYKNDYDNPHMNDSNYEHAPSNKNEWINIIDMLLDIGYYDPHYQDEEDE